MKNPKNTRVNTGQTACHPVRRGDLGVGVQAAERVLLQEAVHGLAVPLPRRAALVDVVHAQLLAPAEDVRVMVVDCVTLLLSEEKTPS